MAKTKKRKAKRALRARDYMDANEQIKLIEYCGIGRIHTEARAKEIDGKIDRALKTTNTSHTTINTASAELIALAVQRAIVGGGV